MAGETAALSSTNGSLSASRVSRYNGEWLSMKGAGTAAGPWQGGTLEADGGTAAQLLRLGLRMPQLLRQDTPTKLSSLTLPPQLSVWLY